MMRFRGGGVSHKSTRQATNFFRKDRHTLDVQNLLDSTSDIIEEMNDFEESEKMESSTDSDVLTRRTTMDTSLERISQIVKMTRSWGTEIWGQRMMGGVQ